MMGQADAVIDLDLIEGMVVPDADGETIFSPGRGEQSGPAGTWLLEGVDMMDAPGLEVIGGPQELY